MKKAIQMTVALLMVLLCLSACNDKDVPSGTLRLDNGVLCWDAAQNASYYEMDMGSGAEQVYQTSYDLAANCKYIGDFSVSVTAVFPDGAREKVGAINLSTQKLGKPVISVQKKDGRKYFTWETEEFASGYTYHAYDGAAMQTAQPDANGTCWVEITDDFEQLIRVVAHGGSKDNQLYLSNEDYFQYTTDEVFDMTKLADYPCVYTASGASQDTFTFGTTLTQGAWDLEITMYVMDSKGRTVQGNGQWGRRTSFHNTHLSWFCETAPSESWPNAANTIPSSQKAETRTLKVDIDRHGNAYINFMHFNKNEMVVITDVKFGGKSRLNASGGLPNAVPEVKKLDTSVLKKAKAYYKSVGDETKNKVKISTDLPDGTHIVDISYYLAMADGGPVYDNGVWGRRITDTNRVATGPYFWLNEWDIGVDFPAVDLPLPTEKSNMRIAVDVKNGKFSLSFIHFKKDEMFIINSVKPVSIPEKNGLFVSKGITGEEFDIKTSYAGVPRYNNVNLDVTFRVYDLDGHSLTGKGRWGRRIVTDNSSNIWLTSQQVDDYKESYNTLPTKDQLITVNIYVAELTRDGVFTLKMPGFLIGECVEVVSVRHKGKLIMGEPVAENEQVTVKLTNYSGWGENFIPFHVTDETKAAFKNTSWFSEKDTSGYDNWTKFSGIMQVDGKSVRATVTVTATGSVILGGGLNGWNKKDMTITIPKENVFTLYQVGNGGGTLKNGGTIQFGSAYEIQVKNGNVTVTEK